MSITKIEKKLQKLIKSFDKDNFIYEMLLSYNLFKSSIKRLQTGNMNMSQIDGEISWKNKLFFKEVFDEDLHISLLELNKNIKHNQRFVIVTDYKWFVAIDTKTQEKLDIYFKELPKHYDFFLPWAGIEKAQHQNENPADVKAAEKMAKLFDEIKKDNPEDSPEFIHGLNVFFSRLLFCFFAEDTNIFSENQFTNALDSHTEKDGSDLSNWIETLFAVLNLDNAERTDLPKYLLEFPYVNGGLFSQKYEVPEFTRRSRQIIIDTGELDWAAINPDIFGSMIQAVVSNEDRGGLGMHYTSVPNIMKVIEPLFLNDLYEEFEKAKVYQEKYKKTKSYRKRKKKNNKKDEKLQNLLGRIHNLKIFDPACGSGNFLIIAYKELRKLEMKIFDECDMTMPFSGITLSQLYGIELDDFAHEVAKLALWLTEHQMNAEFFIKFGRTNPTLPLKVAGRIVQGNACHLDWEEVCPKNNDDEIYILGNPPYLGARTQSKEQKKDMKSVFNNLKGLNNLDYISCWFKKGADFIFDINASFAFVSTNSITQGEQVAFLWPTLLKDKLEIRFAHTSFKWTNNAKGNAGVTVAIIGISNISGNLKYLFNGNAFQKVKNINPYLVSGNNIYIEKLSKTLSQLPEMSFGSMPNDGGFLILSETEYQKIVNENPNSKSLIRCMYGGQDFIKGIKRYCLWINENNLKEAKEILFIENRINEVKKYRLNSKRNATKKLANVAHQFGEIRHQETDLIVIPATSSERRQYIPMGFLSKGTIVNNATLAIYNVEFWHLSVVSSKMHMTWVRTVAGRLEERLRYSSTLCYNTFPFPIISEKQKEEITHCVLRIIGAREKYCERTLAQLYDPDKMPDELREAHRLNDLAIERCYRSKPFESDEERLEYLFKLYEKMIAEEKK